MKIDSSKVLYPYRYDKVLAHKDNGIKSKEHIFCKLVRYYPGSNELVYRLLNKLNVKSLTQRELIMYTITLSGGVFRNQLNYIGLYDSANSSAAMCRITNRINKGYSDKKLIHCNRIELISGLSSLYIADAKTVALTESITANLGITAPVNILDTHKQNIEHAAGVNDYLMYIIGNEHYPFLYEWHTEYAVGRTSKTSQGCLYSDAFIRTTVTSSVQTNATYVLDDFIELHTGSQGKAVIADKLYAYIDKLFEKSQLDATYVQFSITFVIHPAGSCSDKSIASGRSVVTLSKALGNNDTSNYTEKLIRLLGILILEYGTFSVTELLEFLATDIAMQKAAAAANKHPLANETDLYRTSDIVTLTSLFSNIVEDNSAPNFKNIPYTELCKTIRAMENEITYVNGDYADGMSYYERESKIILNDAVNEMRCSYPDSYKKLKAMVLSGLNINTVYGADMYRTSLFNHPMLTGAADAVAHILIECGIIQNTKDCFDKNDELITHPGGMVEIDNSKHDKLLFCNYVEYTDYDNDGAYESALYIESLYNDYGGMKRISKAMGIPELSHEPARIVCLVEDIIDAYDFIARYCFHNIGTQSLVSYQELNNLESTTAASTDIITNEAVNTFMHKGSLGLPIFITRESIIRAMSGRVSESSAYVFKSLSLYREGATTYGKHPDKAFPDYLKKYLSTKNLSSDLCSIYRVSRQK